jgi:hypothetical protein
MPVDKWHALIGDPTLGDAILDRLVHNALGMAVVNQALSVDRSWPLRASILMPSTVLVCALRLHDDRGRFQSAG